jgi:hypothetical protein
VARDASKQRLDLARSAAAKESSAELATLQAQVGAVTGLLVEKLTHTKVGL